MDRGLSGGNFAGFKARMQEHASSAAARGRERPARDARRAGGRSRERVGGRVARRERRRAARGRGRVGERRGRGRVALRRGAGSGGRRAQRLAVVPSSASCPLAMQSSASGEPGNIWMTSAAVSSRSSGLTEESRLPATVGFGGGDRLGQRRWRFLGSGGTCSWVRLPVPLRLLPVSELPSTLWLLLSSSSALLSSSTAGTRLPEAGMVSGTE